MKCKPMETHKTLLFRFHNNDDDNKQNTTDGRMDGRMHGRTNLENVSHLVVHCGLGVLELRVGVLHVDQVVNQDVRQLLDQTSARDVTVHLGLQFLHSLTVVPESFENKFNRTSNTSNSNSTSERQ